MFPQVSRAGEWFLRSGIQSPDGGVARFYLVDQARNHKVSTEITGYSASTLMYLYSLTNDARYLDGALAAARFLMGAWDNDAGAMPFEVEPQAFSYFFDCGIIVRGLLAVWRELGRHDFLECARRVGSSMLDDFAESGGQFHPVLTLPEKQPTDWDRLRWSRWPGCYQLKAGMAWWELWEATGDARYRDAFQDLLTDCLRTSVDFLPGHPERRKVVDRLHAYLYFLEGLLPVAMDERCARALCQGILRVQQYVLDSAADFERSDVYAQLLRLRLFAAWEGVVPLDRGAAQVEAETLEQFAAASHDPRVDGGFYFGRSAGVWVALRESGIDGIRAAGAGAVEPDASGEPPVPDLTLAQPLQFAIWHAAARIAGWRRRPAKQSAPFAAVADTAQAGISVVIPSRSGRELLAAQLPGITRDLLAWAGSGATPVETIVVDNGSDDGTAEWLAAAWPAIQVEVSREPLSFAAAVNRGIARARYSHVCLLNNDMLLDPGFFAALYEAFHQAPGLFCATAQIRFPPGVRREETGKAVMAQAHPDHFPLRCDEPIPGEDQTYVLYGSGGCSLYHAGMLRALNGVDEGYAPAYVEDLDLGYRAWQRGWPTVFVAQAMVEHRHRATTSRYFTEQRLAEILEINYLRFLTHAVADGALFRKLWRQAIDRLRRRGDQALRYAAALARNAPAPAQPLFREAEFLALTGGDVAVFPGGNAVGPPLVTFCERLERPSEAVLARYCEVVMVRKGNDLALRVAGKLAEDKWSNRKQVGRPETRGGAPACPEN